MNVGGKEKMENFRENEKYALKMEKKKKKRKNRNGTI